MSLCPSPHALGPAIDGKRRQFSSSAAADVVYYAADHSRGRPLVLVHDLRLTSSAFEMRPLYESFRWRRPTFALDWPGFGLSDRQPRAYTPGFFVSILTELVRRVASAGSSIDLVALGRGAEIAASLACDEPHLVRSLVLVEPAGLLRARAPAFEAVAARVALAFGDRSARALFALFATRPMVRRALKRRFQGAPDGDLLRYAQTSAQERGAHRAPLAAAASCDSTRASPYPLVPVPVLVVHDARGGRAVALEAFLRGRANRFSIRIAPTCGLPQFERRQQTVAALDRFWQLLSSAASQRAIR